MKPLRIALVLALTMPALGVARADGHDCAPTRAADTAPVTGHIDGDGEIRVYAIQYKQEIRHVETYESFRTKMRCLIRELVMPTADSDPRDGLTDKPTIVVLNEDAGLATVATGTRGAPARAFATHGPKDPNDIPGALGSFASLGATYAPGVGRVLSLAPDTSPQRAILAAATDTFVRGFMRANAELAREYGVYIVSSNNQSEFRETSDAAAIAAFADPDLAAGYATGSLTTVYEPVDVPGPGPGRSGIDVYNQAWMWAPTDPPADHPVQQRFAELNGGPLSENDPRRGIIQVTRKTPLTSLEREILDLSDDADMSEANTGPFCLLPADDPECSIKTGYGISLPSFKWGTDALGGDPFGEPLNEGVDPCGQNLTWMRCLDARGVNLFLQPEANPGMWADYIDRSWSPPAFQALSWLDSAWRAVADPTVLNIRYTVTPHLVGNLVDLTFDGQSVIFERCLPRGAGTTCDGNDASLRFVGTNASVPCTDGVTERCDDPALGPYLEAYNAGAHTLALAPWAMDGDDREELAARARAMQAGSGSAFENAYVETAIYADLDFD